MNLKLRCVRCGEALRGRQPRFCSRACKNRFGNLRHQSYVAQQRRGLNRKKPFIAIAGGGCIRCGYSRNLAALMWHHVEPNTKSFNLDVRALSNRSEEEIRNELGKCVLLCANCHAEEHFPGLDISMNITQS